MRILVVEDDKFIAELLTIILAKQHYAVEVAEDGEAGWELIQLFTYDLIVLNIMLPKLDGISLCRRLRSQGHAIPILMVTGLESSDDKVIGLDAGADDYIVKPFDPKEFLARVRALLRRGGLLTSPILEWGSLRLDPSTCEVTYASNPLPLTPKEYSLLELFLRNSHRVFSYSAILDHIWSIEEPSGRDAVRTHIKGLRQKLKTVGAAADLIETVYGIGYRLKPLEATTTVLSLSTETDKLSPNQTLTAVTRAWNRFYEPAKNQDHRPLLLVVDKDQPLVDQLLKEATDWEIRVTVATDLPRARNVIAQEQPDVVLLDLAVSENTSDGLALLAQLSKQTPPVPVLVLTAQESFTTRQEVVRLGGSAFLQKPIPPVQVLEAVAYVLQPIDSSVDAKVMVVDDDLLLLKMACSLLEPWGFKVITLGNPLNFWETLVTSWPDLLILDIKMPSLSGIELCQVVRNDPRWSALPIIFLTAFTDATTINEVFAAGADDFVRKPIVGPELVSRIVSRLERMRLLRNLAATDPLTRIANRHKSTQELDKFLSLAKRNHESLCLGIIVLEQLPQINAHYGHATGDAILCYLGQLLKESFRREDVVSRWGGEEFMVGMYSTNKTDGLQKLLKVSATLHQQEFVARAAHDLPITLKIGIAQYPEDGADIQSLYRSAVASFHQVS